MEEKINDSILFTKKILDNKKIKYEIIGSYSIRFTTKYSTWIISETGNNVFYLFHKNLGNKRRKKNEMCRFEGYHDQRKSNSYKYLVDYAINHDDSKPMIPVMSSNVEKILASLR